MAHQSILNYTAAFKRNTLTKEVYKAYAGAKTLVNGLKQLREVKKVSKHFSHFFEPVLAQSQAEIEGAHKIRHEVFCKELALFEKCEQKLEVDAYDSYASQCLIKHSRTDTYAGAVRLITPDCVEKPLPIETIALDYITDKKYLPSNFKRDEICEISRIAIPKSYRRRRFDQHEGAAQAGINTESFSELELRCFPFIAIGLYMATAALAVKQGKKHAFFMVEPRLAKSMKYVGIKMRQIGGEFRYVGKRAPFYINYDEFRDGLSPSFKYMLDQFIEKI